MATTATTFVLITCGSCGTTRSVSARHARRGAKSCRSCHIVHGDYERFWLERFSDSEIVTMVEEMASLPYGSLSTNAPAAARSRITSL